MTNDSGNPVPGWHPDPYGRHQHRFWDGTQWTGRVASNGVEANDPIPSAPTPPAQAAEPTIVSPTTEWSDPGQPPGTMPAWGGAAAPPPTKGERGADSGGGGGGKRLLAVGVAALVAAAVVVAAVLLFGGNDTKKPSLGNGAGTFTAELAKGDAKVRTVDMQPGDFITVSWKVTSGDAHVAMAVDRATGEKLTGKSGFLNDSDLSQSLDSAHSLLSDAKDSAAALKDATRQHPYIKVDGFEGVVAGKADAFLTPHKGTFAVIVVGSTKATVKLKITVKHLGKRSSDYNSSQFDSFTGNLDTDHLNSQFSQQCSQEKELSEGFCSSLSDSADGYTS